MRIVRFRYQRRDFWGILDKNHVQLLKKPPFGGIVRETIKIALSKVKLLVPTIPSKIILVGLNYRDHAKELNLNLPNEPIIFLKPHTAMVAHEEKIIYPPRVKRLDYEAELAIVIKKEAKGIKEKDAPEFILGYTCLNDVTARDLQEKDGQWTRSKSFDTFCPIGPWVETKLTPAAVNIKSFVNGRLKQDSNTRQLIFPVKCLVSFVSRVMTLNPGDIISTGTPLGVGPMEAGDRVDVEIQGIGRLTNYVSK